MPFTLSLRTFQCDLALGHWCVTVYVRPWYLLLFFPHSSKRTDSLGPLHSRFGPAATARCNTPTAG